MHRESFELRSQWKATERRNAQLSLPNDAPLRELWKVWGQMPLLSCKFHRRRFIQTWTGLAISDLLCFACKGRDWVSKERPRAAQRRITSVGHGGPLLSSEHLRRVGKRMKSSRPAWDLYWDLGSKIKEGGEEERKGGEREGEEGRKEGKKGTFSSVLYSLPSQRAHKQLLLLYWNGKIQSPLCFFSCLRSSVSLLYYL